mgnify:CR=1 FL=1
MFKYVGRLNTTKGMSSQYIRVFVVASNTSEYVAGTYTVVNKADIEQAKKPKKQPAKSGPILRGDHLAAMKGFRSAKD